MVNINSKVPNRQRLEEFINLAKDHGNIVAKSFEILGSGRTYSDYGRNFEYIVYILERENRRSASQNIAFNLACIKNGQDYALKGKEDDFSNISKEDKKAAEQLLELAASTNEEVGYRAREYCARLLEEGSMINFETKHRDVINKIIDQYRIRVPVEKLHDEFVTEKMAGEMVRNYRPMEMKDTTNAKTQAEKNVNILPEQHHRLKKIIMGLIEKRNKYDRDNYGAHKGLNERFLEICKDWNLSKEEIQKGVLKEIYLETAHKDLKDGKFNRLTDDVLLDVVKENNTEYVPLVPKHVLEKNIDKLNQTNYWKVRSAPLHTNEVERIPDFKISMQDKKELLARAEAESTKNAPKRQQLKETVEDLAQKKEQNEELYSQLNQKRSVSGAIESIQKAYDRIKAYTKESKSAEKDLSKNAVEAVLTDCLNGKQTTISQPEEGSLPLFGRGTEKDRREKLAEAISDFNKVITSELPKIDKEYSGKILQKETLESAKILAEQAEKAASTDWKNLNQELLNGGNQAKAEYEELVRHDKALEDARSKLAEREAQKKAAAKKLVGTTEKTAVKAIPENVEGAEKNKLRFANKQVVDPLAQKEKDMQGKNNKEKIAIQKQLHAKALQER